MLSFFGAADEARTRYLHLGKVALYQMSYSRIFGFTSRLRGGEEDFALRRGLHPFDAITPGGIAFAAAKATAVETIH